VPGKNVSSQKKSTTNPISKAKALNLKQKGGPFKKSLPVHPPKKTISGQMKNPRNPTSKQSRAWNQSSGPLKRPLQGHSHKSFGKIKDLTFKPSIQIQNVAQSKKVAFNSVLKFRKSYKVRLTWSLNSPSIKLSIKEKQKIRYLSSRIILRFTFTSLHR